MGESMIILTGYEGFIGKAFEKKLDPENLYRVGQGGVDLFIEEYEDWDKVDLILHQGAISSTVETDLNKIHKYNVDFSIKLFEKAIEHQIPVKYASSASVYGTNSHGEMNPLNYYAISKLQVDYWVFDNIDKFKSIQGFRYFNVYGDGEEKKGDQASPVSKFAKQIKETGKLKLFKGSTNYFRDFICVDDIVNIVLNNKKPSGVYDLGTSEPVSFEQVAEWVATKYNGEIEHISFPPHLKNKYQGYTCAKKEWDDYSFITVEEYLS
jgi:ADP-L-glycero-D-manno-heptose 6-epimerase